MRIDELHVKGFRCFTDSTFQFNPQFNLIVGNNQAGKTSILEAVAVAAGAWLQGIRGLDRRNLTQEDVQMRPKFKPDDGRFISFEEAETTSVAAKGVVLGQPLQWARDVKGRKGRTTSINAKKLISLAEESATNVRAGRSIVLPLISYYGTERLWLIPKDMQKLKPNRKQEELSRLEGFNNSLDKRCNPIAFLRWMQQQEWIAFQEHAQQPMAMAVKKAVAGCLEGAEKLWFSAKEGTILVEFEGKRVRGFNTLSDGLRNMASMVGDIAIKAMRLNPHLDENAIVETPGVVLIDELDMHLHPRWQRRIVHDLKRTFPKVQFICTTHSPQIIGEVLPEELMMLEAGEASSPENSIGMDSNRVLQELMGTATRNEGVQNQMNEITDLIGNDEYSQAKEKIELLKETVGPLDPEVVHFESMINFLE